MKGLAVDQPIARLGVAWPGCWSVDWQSCHMSEYGIAISDSDNSVRHMRETSA